MTTKTFFNFGIYKSNLKRFYLGSVLYFILLFMSTGMVFLLGYEAYGMHDWIYDRLLDEGGIMFPFFVAICVPTVVALLAYRYLHSKKAGVFTHSMPVTRLENYVSTVLAAFTLMAVPVVVNALILTVMSQCGYGYLFGLKSVLTWTGMNLLTLFVMFSMSTFSAFLVGNSFALVTINVLLHILLPIIGVIIEGLSSQFLYGYTGNISIYNELLYYTPLAYLSYTVTDISDGNYVGFLRMGAFIAFAIVLYVISYFLYKKRNVEINEDVAAFKVLNPIAKYFITFLVSVGAYTLFGRFIAEKPMLFVIVVLIISAVVYFSMDMILKKKVKIWKEAYKGYIGFLAVFTAVMCFVTFTSVFGYETYVPDTEKIETAAIYNYYYQDVEPFTESEEVNKYITEVHKKILEGEIPVYDSVYPSDCTRMHFNYKMSNGNVVTRVYYTKWDFTNEVLNKLYEYPEYKQACEEVYRKDATDIIEVEFNNESIKGTVDEFNELLECMKRDTDKLGYSDIHDFRSDNRYCYLRYIVEDEYGDYYRAISVSITKKYTETLEWFKAKGYDYLFEENAYNSDMNPNSFDGFETATSFAYSY